MRLAWKEWIYSSLFGGDLPRGNRFGYKLLLVGELPEPHTRAHEVGRCGSNIALTLKPVDVLCGQVGHFYAAPAATPEAMPPRIAVLC